MDTVYTRTHPGELITEPQYRPGRVETLIHSGHPGRSSPNWSVDEEATAELRKHQAAQEQQAADAKKTTKKRRARSAKPDKKYG